MLCFESLQIAPGLIEIMPPHHLSVLLVVLGFLFNLGICSRFPSSMMDILGIAYEGLRSGDFHLTFYPLAPHGCWFVH